MSDFGWCWNYNFKYSEFMFLTPKHKKNFILLQVNHIFEMFQNRVKWFPPIVLKITIAFNTFFPLRMKKLAILGLDSAVK